MPYSRPYGSGGFKDTPDTSTPITAAALNTIDVGVANAHTDIANTLATIPSRNRIVNGSMMVDQRSNGAAQTGVSASGYACDRFSYLASGGGVVTLQRVANDGPPGVSPFSAKITVTTADSSIAAGDYYRFSQAIEGYNIADLGFGTASPQPIVLSFYVKSSLTGTFGGAFRNPTGRSYAFSYSISAANTWERKTVALTADSTGTWDSTNGNGLAVIWSLGHGSTYTTGTANAWVAGDFNQPSGTTQVISTAGATWQISGVQLEYGTTPTRFEHRPFDDELRRCQRYYYRANANDLYGDFAYGWTLGTTAFIVTFPTPVPMRAVPSGSPLATNGSTQLLLANGNQALVTGTSFSRATSAGVQIQGTNQATTATTPCWLRANNDATAWVAITAEL